MNTLNPRALAAVTLLLSGCTPPDKPWFVDEASERGIRFQHKTGATGAYLLPEIIGSGSAMADFDGDGDLDIYLVQSGGFDAGEMGNELFLNRGDGRFLIAEASGAEDNGYGMGVAVGDYDSDGDVDIYVTNVGENVLLRNDGLGHFEDVTEAAGVDDSGWGTAAVFVDLDADGDLDLFSVNYLNWTRAGEIKCYGRGSQDYCPPESYNRPAPDRLFRNDGDGSFTDVSKVSGINAATGNGLGVIVGDYNRDGLTDLFIANDMTVNHLWLNRGALTFSEQGMRWGVALDANGLAKSGMGVAAGDVDDDGDSDLLVVNMEGQADSFFRNDGDYYTDSTTHQGLALASRRFTRWGVAMVDFDNDGYLDLYQANGRLNQSVSQNADPYGETNLLYQGKAGGVFQSLAGSLPQTGLHSSRGLTVGDVDDDGGLDLLVVNRDGPVYLLMNKVSGAGNWVRFELLNRSGCVANGADIAVKVGTRQVTRSVQTAGSYLAANDPRVHFGLGDESDVREVTVTWPGGSQESFGDFPAGHSVVLREGQGHHKKE